MPDMFVDGKKISVREGTTVLEAARAAGVSIPALCTLPGFDPEPSCLVCVVKDESSGRLIPACAARVEEGMHICTSAPEVLQARERVLELLVAEHVGDCESPCRRGCPLFIDVDRAIGLLCDGDPEGAAAVFLEHNPFPSLMGRLCAAPCEKVCRRGQWDGAVSVRMLEKHAGDLAGILVPVRAPASGLRVAVVGAGPAGLSAAYQLSRLGHAVTIYEQEKQLGGGFRAALGDDGDALCALDREIERITALGVTVTLGTRVGADVSVSELADGCHALVLASGEMELGGLEDTGIVLTAGSIVADRETFATARPGVFAVGAAVRHTKRAVHALREGRAAALALNMFLLAGAAAAEHRPFDSHLMNLAAEELDVFMRSASPAAGNPRKTGAFSTDEAVAEAARCLSCACRKRSDCSFRTAVTAYAPAWRVRLTGRAPFRRVDTHPEVVLEPGKCVKCGRCVRIGAARKEPLGLAFIGRGFDMTVGAPFGRPLSEALTFTAAECVAACPTGALAWKRGKGN